MARCVLFQEVIVNYAVEMSLEQEGEHAMYVLFVYDMIENKIRGKRVFSTRALAERMFHKYVDEVRRVQRVL